MAEYVSYPLEADPDALAQEAFDYIAARIAGWQPSPGDPLTIALESFAQIAAELIEVASDVPTAIYRYLGASLFALPPVEASRAAGTSTWTMRDDAGYTIPAGTVVGIPAAGDQLVGFETVADVVVPPGSTTTAAGEVALLAVEAGAAGSGLTGPVTLIDSLAFVTGVALVGQTTGGVDAESDADYLDRLTAELRLLSPRPILPEDFAVMARRVSGVERATAVDGYNPADGTTDNERMVTVAVVDAAGQPVSTATRNAVDALLQAEREVTFIVHVIDPTYTAVDVTFTATALPGFDPADVEARAEAAVADYLSPANWGRTASTGATWLNRPIVRYLEVAEIINRVDGVDYIDALTVEAGTVDVPLTGVVPLPTAGAIAGTVNAP